MFKQLSNLLIVLLATATSSTYAARVQVRNLPGVKPIPAQQQALDNFVSFGKGQAHL